MSARSSSETDAAVGHRFYGELARWWPLVSPVEDYLEEANEFARVLHEAVPEAQTLLELGSGGGHNAFHLKRDFRMTLSDISAEMLAVSQRLNPECEHVQGDMRSLEVGQTFDAVFVHDAVHYMTTEQDLRAAIATAHRHCRPGGAALFVPDVLRESFEPTTDCGGSDGPDGAGIRYLEWSYAPSADATVGTLHYAFILREADGTVRSLHETHAFSMFARETWLRSLAQQGFAAEVITERTTEDRAPRTMFLARRAG
jgi:SAM-dependent methyltransferase